MFVVLTAIAVALAALGMAYWLSWRWDRTDPGPTRKVLDEGLDPNCLTSAEAKEEAIQAAETVEDLEFLWAAWESRGWSRNGMLYATLLERKKEIQGWLTKEEKERILDADRRWRHGKNLPKITGRRRVS